MEVVVIDKATFERMLSGFEIFAEKVERLCREQEDLGEKEWLDSDDVCRLLCISPRTLQTMRENGTLAYTKISHKVYYRPEDVKSIFPVTEMKRCITAGKERKCNVSNKQTNKPPYPFSFSRFSHSQQPASSNHSLRRHLQGL